MGFRFIRNVDRRQADNSKATLDAISRALAIIEFSVDGIILDANQNFLALMGYTLDEVVGQHHRIFVDPVEAASREYSEFWARLGKGQFQAAEYHRRTKSGDDVWLQATYSPVLSNDGNPLRIVKVASDITQSKLVSADFAGQMSAISRSQAVIEFSPDGTVLGANENFCQVIGYSEEEIRGRHHRLFVSEDEAKSPEYREFWRALGRGEFQASEYRRLGKGGREVWIQATYNPIFDFRGQVFKIVKYATDITARKHQVNLLGQGLTRLAEGDLRSTIDARFTGDLETVRLAYNHTVDRLAQIMSGLRHSSSMLHSATADILAGTNDLAMRTARQAAAIQETSAAMANLSATVHENAGRAQAASGKARSVTATAEASGVVMSQAQEAMERILSSSAKIANIAGMIDDIAFQTNLLALNASVEAARAGEAGTGFAVVAIEVRRLAQSAAAASADVKALIERSSSEISAGSRLISDADSRISSMLADVRENSELMDAIASGSKAQSQAIAEAAAAIHQMDEMTQRNAALVEETNAAIQQTDEQARSLDAIAEIFLVAPPMARTKAGQMDRSNGGPAALETDRPLPIAPKAGGVRR